jgi:hypothetical protein
LVPPEKKPASIAPSLLNLKAGVGTLTPTNGATDDNGLSKDRTEASKDGPPYPYPTPSEPGNPTVVPKDLLEQFHFTFLIRHPRSSIPSYYRCTIPPLDEVTGFYNFMPSEAGYDEVRRVFDYLRSIGQIGPNIAGQENDSDASRPSSEQSDANSQAPGVDICVIDADDLLDNPSGIIEAFCRTTGIDYTPEMLKWDNEEDHKIAKEAFEKWKGFHEDAIHSSELKPRTHVRIG